MAYNGTRVSSQEGFQVTIFRMNKGIKVYHLKHPDAWVEISEEKWNTYTEMHGVFRISGLAATLVQTEKAFTKALGFVVKRRCLQDFRADEFELVDLEDMKASHILPKVTKPRAAFIEVGKKTLFRATLEAERRFCGNKTDALTGAGVIADDSTLMALVIDCRTINSFPSLGLQDEFKKALTLLKEQYVVFGMTAWKYRQSKKPPKESTQENENTKKASVTTSSDSMWAEFETGDDDLKPAPAVVEEDPEPTEDSLISEFKYCVNRYRKRCAMIDWNKCMPKESKGNEGEDSDSDSDSESEDGIEASSEGKLDEVDILKLWKCDMGKVIKDIIEEDKDGKMFGYLPTMATAFKASIAQLLASSFCERINSAANIVLGDDNLKLAEVQIDKMTVLRVNREFMICMRTTYNWLTLEKLKAMYGDITGNSTASTSKGKTGKKSNNKSSKKKGTTKTMKSYCQVDKSKSKKPSKSNSDKK